VSGSFDVSGRLSISDGRIIVAVGKKRSGKSVMVLSLFRTYPWDRVVIDVAGDDGPHGAGAIEIRGAVQDIPSAWSRAWNLDGKAALVRYVPDPGSPTYLADMDAMVALALRRGQQTGHCGLLIHEGGEVAPSNRTPPNMRRALMQSRHQGLSMFIAMPRALSVDPLIIGQADVVYVFDLPNPDDRKRVANSIGMDPLDFELAWRELEAHEYLRYDSNEPRPPNGAADTRMLHFPPLPRARVESVLRWAKGGHER